MEYELAASALESLNSSLQVLGRSAATRRLLLAVFVTMRYHLLSRPISFANDSFFCNHAQTLDQILETLRDYDWEALDAELEKGIAELDLISSGAGDLGWRMKNARRIAASEHRYFRGLVPPWPALPAIGDLSLDSWPKPTHILFAVGPNIGVGDEMILFAVARGLTCRYPQAHLEVSSFNRTLWDRCPFISEVHYHAHNPIAPYARAKNLLEATPSALIFFADFFAPAICRQLERVPGFDRFMYFDSGKRVVRIVDRSKPGILEYFSSSSRSIYEVVRDLAQRIGLICDSKDLQSPETHVFSRPQPPSRFRVFVNPFSSKDMSAVGPAWWAKALNSAASRHPLEAEIFCGINSTTRKYAHAVADALDLGACRLQFHGEHETPSLAETLDVALSCDAVLGVDTFTGHLGNLRRIPSVTVFLSPPWAHWRVPDSCVLNASVHDEPERVGALLARLLVKPIPPVQQLALELKNKAEALRPLIFSDHQVELLEPVRQCLAAGAQVLRSATELRDVFADVPAAFVGSFEAALKSQMAAPDSTPALRKLLRVAWEIWEDSNFCRYIRYVTESTASVGQTAAVLVARGDCQT